MGCLHILASQWDKSDSGILKREQRRWGLRVESGSRMRVGLGGVRARNQGWTQASNIVCTQAPG